MVVFEIIKELSNHCLNEKVHNMKVVDLEKLFHLRPRRWRKIEIT